MVARGRAWLQGGVRGCRGACMVVGGHAWLWGGHAWLPRACVVAGGVHCCGGACVVARGHAWLQGMGACVVAGVRRIRQDTVNKRAVRILLECILVL